MRRTHLAPISLALAASIAACTLVDLDELDRGRGGGTSSSSSTVGTATAVTTGTTLDGSSTSSSTSSSAANSGTSSATGMPALLDGCVLLFHLEEETWSAPGSVVDASPAANHGSPQTAMISTAGRYGNGAVFDGSASIVVTHSPSLQPSTALTYAAWVKADSFAGDPGIFSKRIGFGQEVAFTLFAAPSTTLGGVTWSADIETNRFESNALAELDVWTHLAVVYDATLPETQRSHLYVDGNLVTVARGPDMFSANIVDLLIGNLPGGGGFFEGTLDEVAVWTRALSDAEILAIAQSDAPLQ